MATEEEVHDDGVYMSNTIGLQLTVSQTTPMPKKNIIIYVLEKG